MTPDRDPMLAAIDAYRQAEAAYVQFVRSTDDDEAVDAFTEEHLTPARDAIIYQTPHATTRAGAAEALRAALAEKDTCDPITAPLIRAALAWLDGETSA
ncbi:hypothetical protein U0C82_14395 [Fulvimarina sp. 2208YS6-2-32]|uniref:Uncharacterized protein n=1 Tax=Fulvimarina uroteuthidis TaxID=3098149 RepID=A0ABU5I4M2_9HYPH|nr:hypothetical protein [Fulvimarina sp. 2208YS6-2-32]MDY8110329.1 hypothetical protein [Fulvimarina sp. 2208YS6-2-32]